MKYGRIKQQAVITKCLIQENRAVRTPSCARLRQRFYTESYNLATPNCVQILDLCARLSATAEFLVLLNCMNQDCELCFGVRATYSGSKTKTNDGRHDCHVNAPPLNSIFHRP